LELTPKQARILMDSYQEHQQDELIVRMRLAGMKVPDELLDGTTETPRQDAEAFRTPVLDAIEQEDFAARIARMSQQPGGTNLVKAFQG
jgi:hypothetical protein